MSAVSARFGSLDARQRREPRATGTPLLNITGQDITVIGGYGLGA